MSQSEVFAKASKEFETLTNKRAATLKNKGKEEGVKKLLLLFKSGKTLEQRVQDFDDAELAASMAGTRRAAHPPMKLLENLRTAHAKLNEGLKKNIADYTASEQLLGREDEDIKAGHSVFINRMAQIGKQAKITLVLRESELKTLAGQAQSADEELVKWLKTIHLGIRKGVEETEALMKLFIARPSDKTLKEAFSSGSGPRSIGAAATTWKQKIAAVQPKLADKIGFDPETLLEKIAPLTQGKPLTYWQGVLTMDQPGWEDRAKVVANACLAQMKLWRLAAERIKALIK